MDNGQNFSREDLKELPMRESTERVISKGVLNLQNRDGLLEVNSVEADQWLSFDFKLQPSLYQLRKGDCLQVLLYTTDFEHTVRDNSDYELRINLEKSYLSLPIA